MLLAAVLTTGLMAGLYFAFDVAVMPALTAAEDRTLVDAMQTMVTEIENPVFLLTFMAAPVLAAVALVQAVRAGASDAARWIVGGLVLYGLMCAVTFGIHFPLNEELQQAGDPGRIDDLAAVRGDFVTPWVAWNIVRTIVTTAAFGCLAWALVLRARYPVRTSERVEVG